MALKLIDFDIKQFIQRKPTYKKDPASGKMVEKPKNEWLDYVEWSQIWQILTKEYTHVDFWSEKHPDFVNTLIIHIELNDQKFKMNYPIINGNAVITQPTQMDIHKAELRGFVKAAAKYTGLGLSLWQKDEAIEVETPKQKPVLITEKSIRTLKTVKQLTDMWNTLPAESQLKFKSVFAERRKEIEDGF